MTRLFFLPRVRFALLAVACLGVLTAPGMGRADVFNLPHFVTPGEFALGLEPELTLTSGAGIGINARYTQGLTDLLNVSGIIGTGGGPRRFRAGADLAFDFFPDIQGQPGIGLGTRALFVRVPVPTEADPGNLDSQVELTALPYIHKSFMSGSNEVEPFFSVPFGMAFTNGQYKAISTAVVGSMFKASEHVRYSAEFGIAINHTESYLAGGVTYYH